MTLTFPPRRRPALLALRGCLQFESPSPAERGCEKSRSDGIIQNEVILKRMLSCEVCLSLPSPQPLSQRDKHCSRSERGARSPNYQHAPSCAKGFFARKKNSASRALFYRGDVIRAAVTCPTGWRQRGAQRGCRGFRAAAGFLQTAAQAALLLLLFSSCWR